MSKLLQAVAIFWTLSIVATTGVYADVLVSGPNTRITQIDTNWGNEGRFGVHVVGGQPGSLCGGWVHFNDDYLAADNKDAHKFNLMMATTAMIMNKQVEILGDGTQCWRAVSIRVIR